MTATNQQMTSEQLAELMVVAVCMQRDAEKLDERPVAVFAYAVQLALAELQQAKQQLLELSVKLANVESKCAEVVVENAGLKSAAEFATAPDMWIEQADGMLDYRYVDWYVDVLKAAMKAPATDAAIANIQAQGVEMFAQTFNSGTVEGSSMKISAIEFAAQLRQGGEHE